MVVAGVDYSLTSPAICVHSGEEWSYSNCKFYYMVQNEKKITEAENYHCSVYPEWSEDCERFNNLAEWSLHRISSAGCSRVAIEGYAFGAVGRVFQIAENAGLLKYKLWENGIEYTVPAPTEIKKFATGKGNANKDLMLEAYKEETGVDIREKLDIIKGYNPISDIVDAYYIAKFGFYNGKKDDSNI